MMEWLNNANVIAGLIVAIFSIGGYIFAIVTYLKGKAEKSLHENRPSLQNVRSVKTEEVRYFPINSSTRTALARTPRSPDHC